MIANWTTQNTCDLTALIKERKTVLEIANVIGVSDWKIRMVMKTFGMTIKINNSGAYQIRFEESLSPKDHKLLITMLRSGVSHLKIGAHFGVMDTTVARARSRLGITDNRVYRLSKGENYRRQSKPQMDLRRQKERKCLGHDCGVMFLSWGPGNHICPKCSGTMMSLPNQMIGA